MNELMQVYKCGICGNIVEVIHTGKGALVCCGEPMVHLVENTVDAAKEKHYMEWIELIVEGKSYRKFLNPGELPIAEFCVPDGNEIVVREYCNLHGAWKAKL